MTTHATPLTAATSQSTQVSPASQVATVAVLAAPIDRACGYWAKVIRFDEPIPLPSHCSFADDIRPYPYLQRNEHVHLGVGDVLLEGESVHKSQKHGWIYWITLVVDGEALVIKPDSSIKKYLRASGLPPEIIVGSGKIAAILRVAHAHRRGINLMPILSPN